MNTPRVWTLIACVVVAWCATPRVAAATLIEGGRKTEWRYWDEATAPVAGWKNVGFDAAAWKRGRGGLGYGQDDVVTKIGFGRDPARKHAIAYFRREFEVSGAQALRQLVLLMRVDDGAIVYLNGKEVARENVEGAGAQAKVPRGRVVETAFRRHVLATDGLMPGKNCVAVEVYQGAPNSSDLFFDLALKAYGAGEEPVAGKVAAGALGVSRAFLQEHYLSADARIPDGYADGGRASKIASDGSVTTGREAMVVDRARDAALQRHLEYARETRSWRVPEREHAALLALYIDRLASPAEGRGATAYACEMLTGEYRGKELLIGQAAGAGMCRHRALLFKLMADEAGLRATMARGNLGTPRDAGGHTWNELVLENGEKVIVDVMNPRPGFYFPRTTEPAAEKYLTVKNAAYYPRVATGTN